MMKYFLILIISLLIKSSFAQQMSYSEWQEKARTEINLQPEYGNIKKDAAHIAVDREFIDEALKQDTTAQKASNHLVQLGFNYLSRGDVQTAMKRFNQAWLLDPANENVYWGFGAIYGSFNDYKLATVQYDKGLSINPRSSLILTDKATLYFIGFQQDHVQEKLKTALDLLNQAYNIDSNNVNTNYKLSICYFLNNDCTNAWKFYKECQRVGGQPIAQNFTEALKSKCPTN